MELKLFPGALRGAVSVPPSKSELHRALLCAALSQSETLLPCVVPPQGETPSCAVPSGDETPSCAATPSGEEPPPCAVPTEDEASLCAAPPQGETPSSCAVPSGDIAGDIAATARNLAALGVPLTCRDGGYYVNSSAAPALNLAVPPQGETPSCALTPVLDCGESGSTLRFLLPVTAALGCGGRFLLGARLRQRPVEPMLELLRRSGCTVWREDSVLCLTGQLRPGHFVVDCAESSQFLSGLLLALPLLPGSSAAASGKLPSKSYVNLTCAVMARFGVSVAETGGVYTAAGAYRSCGRYVPEGDWSAAAFWLCANALGSRVDLAGLNPESVQGDRAFPRLCEAVRRGGAVLDLGDVPDLLPPLAVLAALTPGETRFTGASRLRRKESDRLAAMAALLSALGADCRETAEGLCIHGVSSLRGGCTVDSRGDHRIAMAAAIAALRADGPVTLRGAECVEKSYPAFWSEFRALGGKTE